MCETSEKYNSENETKYMINIIQYKVMNSFNGFANSICNTFSVLYDVSLTYAVSTTGSPTIDTSISGYTQYLFTTTGTFNITNISKNIDINIFAVGGGGGGGITNSYRDQAGGGGGGGGVIQVYKTTKSNSLFNIIIGNGGSNTTNRIETADPGGDTIVKYNSNDLVTAFGGGPGADYDRIGRTGGSCSGNPPGRQSMPEITQCTYSIDWSLVLKAGNKGGSGAIDNFAGGGGGAGAVGGNATSTRGGDGGAGITPSMVNTKQVFTSNIYAGGGGGGNKTNSTQSSGGTGGGGKGCSSNNYANKDGTVNTGGGGGGGKQDYSNPNNGANFFGGNGGSGICIISIPTGIYSYINNISISDYNMYYLFTSDFNNSGKNAYSFSNTNVINSTLNSIPCAYFNGSAFIDIGFQNFTNATFGFWIYYTGSSSSSITPISMSSLYSDLYTDPNSGIQGIWLFAKLGSASNNVNILANNNNYMNTWLHITYIYSQTPPYACSIYINGTQKGTANGTGAFANTPSTLRLGKGIENVQQYTGFMRNFFLIDSILTDDQISYLYTNTKFI